MLVVMIRSTEFKILRSILMLILSLLFSYYLILVDCLTLIVSGISAQLLGLLSSTEQRLGELQTSHDNTLRESQELKKAAQNINHAADAGVFLAPYVLICRVLVE